MAIVRRLAHHPDERGQVIRYGEAPTMADIDPDAEGAPTRRPTWAMRLLLRAMGLSQLRSE